MYPLIYCILKRLKFRYLLKIANIGKKRYTKSLEIRKIAVPLHQILENIDSENASRDGIAF